MLLEALKYFEVSALWTQICTDNRGYQTQCPHDCLTLPVAPTLAYWVWQYLRSWMDCSDILDRPSWSSEEKTKNFDPTHISHGAITFVQKSNFSHRTRNIFCNTQSNLSELSDPLFCCWFMSITLSALTETLFWMLCTKQSNFAD